MADINQIVSRHGLSNSTISYQDLCADQSVKVVRPYCSSPRCSNGSMKLTAKKMTSTFREPRPDGTFILKRPTYCPDCGYALVWRKVRAEISE